MTLVLILALAINAAAQAHVNAGDGIDATSQAGSKPAAAAPYTRGNIESQLYKSILCPSGNTISQRYDIRDSKGRIMRAGWIRYRGRLVWSGWKRTCLQDRR